MFAAPSCTICVIAAASLHVSKKSCHNALSKQLLLQLLNLDIEQALKSFWTDMKKPPRLSPRRFFYAPVWQGRWIGKFNRV
jgi:hypothetical protein